MTSHESPHSVGTASGTVATPEGGAALGERAVRTREAILEASRKLFLERGYAGTRINNITDACGISRAGFYTYFRDKREVFNTIGEETYKEILAVVSLWSDIPSPAALSDVASWVRQYFDFMDRHGAFIFSSTQSAPTDDEFRRTSQRTQMRVAWLLGTNLVSRQERRYEAPEALGLTMMAMLDQSYFYSRVWRLPVDDEDMISTLAEQIHDLLANGR
ncbi:TetR/AcrR family transcriptional regulator [Williamsia muralis]|uniref:TetR/AcrR family transcriptional regulator n=1 Tax=Williamsia marianensis TaxID=85044 RepID=A0ABU4F0Y4_WILMA|nr:TetR/AcrR family transcriptional regulator [Williamsia muralis]MDV7136529.1 TetR/AcrR family transcriptional regulator [Williamsia muralis]